MLRLPCSSSTGWGISCRWLKARKCCFCRRTRSRVAASRQSPLNLANAFSGLEEQLRRLFQIYELGPLRTDEVRALILARRPAASESLIDRMEQASLGNPLYFKGPFRHAQRRREFRCSSLPGAVDGYFRRATRGLADSPALRDVLGLLAVSRKSLSLLELSQITGFSQRQNRQEAVRPIPTLSCRDRRHLHLLPRPVSRFRSSRTTYRTRSVATTPGWRTGSTRRQDEPATTTGPLWLTTCFTAATDSGCWNESTAGFWRTNCVVSAIACSKTSSSLRRLS